MKRQILAHEFVEYLPKDLKEGTIYVSMTYATAAHKCCCGCGNEVVTPITPTDWELTFDGESISLDPSIGNWSLPCQSHYWIAHNKVKWARKWSKQEIEAGRMRDRIAKEQFFDDGSTVTEDARRAERTVKPTETLWQRLKRCWF